MIGESVINLYLKEYAFAFLGDYHILQSYKFSVKIEGFFKFLVFFSGVFSLSLNKRGQKFLFINLGDFNSLRIELSFMLDIFARVFLLTVSLIRLSVFTFRFSYISNQKFFGRFHTLLLVFVISIIVLVLSSNLIFTLVG